MTFPIAGVTGGVITSGHRTVDIPYHGGGAEDVVAWIRMQIDAHDDVVDPRSLPRPQGQTVVVLDEGDLGDGANGLSQSAEPTADLLGVADEIRKLGELLNEGLLTDEEFTAQKGRLLQGLTQGCGIDRGERPGSRCLSGTGSRQR